MQQDKKELINQIKSLSNYLDGLYESKTNFRNHCYLRIAYDNTCGGKWDLLVNKPFVDNATPVQLTTAVEYLNRYKNDFEVLVSDNKKSLNFRKRKDESKNITY